MTNDAAYEQNLLKDEDFERALYRQSYRNKVFLIIKIILFCVILLGVGTYPLYPASQIRGLELQGNYLLSKDACLRYALMKPSRSPSITALMLPTS